MNRTSFRCVVMSGIVNKSQINILAFICWLCLTTNCWCQLNFNNISSDATSPTASSFNNHRSSRNIINLYSVRWLHLPSTMRNLSMVIRRRTFQSKSIPQDTIDFLYYKNGKLIFKTNPGADNSRQTTPYILEECGGNEKTSFIFHGWTESCTTDWVTKLMDRLTFYRGGCIICIDYRSWSEKPYLDLVQRFNDITQILYEEMLTLLRNGLNPSNGYMFGFSYGGQLASKIGRFLIHHHGYKFKQIDICDMAGPGFDFLSYSQHSEAAENVQCYYTSLDKGSQFRSCHRNILLGNCGYTQPAILSQPYFSSHGLSVRIYVNAFDYPFYAVQKAPAWCLTGKSAQNLPEGIRVGYTGDIPNHIIGDIFVPTGLNYPYNLSKRELILYEKYLNGT